MDITEALVNAIPDVGVGLIFLYLYVKERDRSQTMTNQWMEMIKKNITSNHAVATALDANTKVVMKLSDLWQDGS